MLQLELMDDPFCFRLEATIFNGKEMAKAIIAETKKEVKEWIEGGHKKPALSVIRCGPTETDYKKSVVKACNDVGRSTMLLNTLSMCLQNL
jgi:5,10-methylene-tetrahydrofolate dehydrogenase/Methenyl tetrahydrofolate cyclohydrolase